MTFLKRIAGATALSVAMLIGAGLSAPPVQAGYIVTLDQVGSNVVATGNGTIDLTDLTTFGPDVQSIDIFPNVAFITAGSARNRHLYGHHWSI